MIRKLNNQRKFINQFVSKQGFALWNKAVVTPIHHGNSAARIII